MSELEDAKRYWANNHSQSSRILAEGEGQDHRYVLARHILSLEPTSVLEFGCSSGRNLGILRNMAGTALKLFGIDMNIPAIAAGNRTFTDINLTVGDEKELKNYADNSVDVVFTCSVLDHIPDPAWKSVYDDLVRISRKAVVLLEPMYKELKPLSNPMIIMGGGDVYEGDLASVADTLFPNGLRVVPFTYSWDYPKYDPLIQFVGWSPIPTDAQDSGEYYWLMERKK